MKFQVLLLLLCIIFLYDDNSNYNMSCSKPRLVFTTPQETFRSYLNAILCGNFEGAKKCWVISDGNRSGALDVISGLWVTYHRFNKVISDRFNSKASEFIREDCTESAIRRTLSRLNESDYNVKDGKAVLILAWKKDDGYPDPAFFYKSKIPFLKTKSGWKLDADEMTGEKPENFFKPGGWGKAMLSEIKVLNILADEVENGKIQNFNEFLESLHSRNAVAQEQWIKEHKCKKP